MSISFRMKTGALVVSLLAITQSSCLLTMMADCFAEQIELELRDQAGEKLGSKAVEVCGGAMCEERFDNPELCETVTADPHGVITATVHSFKTDPFFSFVTACAQPV